MRVFNSNQMKNILPCVLTDFIAMMYLRKKFVNRGTIAMLAEMLRVVVQNSENI